MSEVSSDLVFHFTSEPNTVLSILKNGFYPRMSKENMSIVLPAYDNVTLGMPMVCFTDIPLDRSSEHRAQYGSYGLGLSKEWAKRHKISPVFYMIRESGSWEIYNHMQAYVKKLIQIIDIFKKTKEMQDISDEAVSSLIELSGYIKPYSEDGSEKIFYDEREWRYVPPFRDIPDYCNWLLPEMLNGNTELEKLNRKMEVKYALEFSVDDDLKKIIVPIKADMSKIQSELYSLKCRDPEALIRKIEQL